MRASRSLLLGVLLGVLSGAGVAQVADTPPPLHYDHANPFVLNEFALQKARAGDTGTAVILLERAALIAPYDARIGRNLDVLRNRQAGRRAAAPQEQGLARRPAAVLEAELPEISPWPLK